VRQFRPSGKIVTDGQPSGDIDPLLQYVLRPNQDAGFLVMMRNFLTPPRSSVKITKYQYLGAFYEMLYEAAGD
jgi:hypothetical protein